MELLLGCRRTSLLLFFGPRIARDNSTVLRYLSPSPSALEITLAQTKIQVVPGMLIEKLVGGIVRVQTPIGPRYVMASFLQRIYLLWMFRNFAILPYAVLNGRQQRMIDRMCSEQRFKWIACVNGMDEAPVIGTIERRPTNQSLPPRHAVARETGTLAA